MTKLDHRMAQLTQLSTYDRTLLLWHNVVGTIIALLFLLLVIAGGPDHADVIAEVESVRQQIVEINCVAFIPVTERDVLALAECRTDPPEGTP